ncbi:MAG: hypothetical protein ACK4GC_14450, partial [Paracoccaceae bacterium]
MAKVLRLILAYLPPTRLNARVRERIAMRYSGFKVISQGLFGNAGWKPAWRDPAPKAEYDAVIIGGG